MAYQRYYLKAFKEKYGDKKKAFKGKNPEQLGNWRKENWLDIRSVLRDPKNPTACGNEVVKEGEYPLCMKEKEIKKYSKGELALLQNRKNEIGDTRLVKDSFLRDMLKPEETPPEKLYKEKYVTEKKLKMPKPLPKAKREKILAEPNIKLVGETIQEVTIPTVPRQRGRPKLSPEVLKANQEATLQRRRDQRQKTKEANQQQRAEIRKTKAEEKARAKAEAQPKAKIAQPPPERPLYNARATGQEAIDYDTQMAKFTDYEISKGRIVTNPKPYKMSLN
jgi:hypothetical protein